MNRTHPIVILVWSIIVACLGGAFYWCMVLWSIVSPLDLPPLDRGLLLSNAILGQLAFWYAIGGFLFVLGTRGIRERAVDEQRSE